MTGERRDAVVLTVSDGVAAGTRDDTAGQALAAALAEAGWTVAERAVVADEVDLVAAALRSAAAAGRAVVVTTGGTGFGPRDVTPEATLSVATRRAAGLAERMRAVGRGITPMADLSRAEAVIVDRTLVVNVPGSRKGAVEGLDAVLELLPHAVQLLGGATQQHPTGHGTEGVPHAASGEGAPTAHPHRHDPSDPCFLAHTPGLPEERRPGTLVAVYASPVAATLLDWGRTLGYRRVVLVEPDEALEERLGGADAAAARHARAHADVVVTDLAAAGVDDDTDVVVTDHGREGLVGLADAMLRSDARHLGLMGSARHLGPHVDGLLAAGWSQQDVDRIERPVGLPIGSRTPPEIALSVLAGLVRDRHGAG